ncbi:MAG: UDP-4-amino-4,6-dideoxy-N-acetyl-beta-L-altrosamine transaminase [Planctomycetes bacterium]|nr:UDP-4-amino-4,6-dideoxy-N-acetyl-beta-L-altrosamine transaminase [Planctomycetota bacterium]
MSDSSAGAASRPLPYGRQSIDEEDIQAVVEVLRSDWLTTGPKVAEFERAFANFCGAAEAVAVSNGTAALHAMMFALGIGPTDEVIVPTLTFAATANAAVFQGARPVFADVDPETLLIDPASVESRITPQTRAIIAVDYAGQPCDYPALQAIADRHQIPLLADACHSLGGGTPAGRVGTLAAMNAFSFHPVKPLTTGEGGMVTTNDANWASRMRVFRNHGITTDHRQREQNGAWFYEMVDLGFNYRLTDMQCALGLRQLKKLPHWVQRRQQLADLYREQLKSVPAVTPLAVRAGASHAYHLFVVRVGSDRQRVFTELRGSGIGVNVHYIPVHLHPFYQRTFGTHPGLCPVAETASQQILSLPMFPAMQDADVERVVQALAQAVA